MRGLKSAGASPSPEARLTTDSSGSATEAVRSVQTAARHRRGLVLTANERADQPRKKRCVRSPQTVVSPEATTARAENECGAANIRLLSQRGAKGAARARARVPLSWAAVAAPVAVRVRVVPAAEAKGSARVRTGRSIESSRAML